MDDKNMLCGAWKAKCGWKTIDSGRIKDCLQTTDGGYTMTPYKRLYRNDELLDSTKR